MKNILKSFIFLFILLVITISTSLCLGKSEVNEKHFITLKGRLLSIDAHEVLPEDVLKDLGQVCGIKIVISEDSFSNVLVSIEFRDLPLKEGMKKILKLTGVKN